MTKDEITDIVAKMIEGVNRHTPADASEKEFSSLVVVGIGLLGEFLIDTKRIADAMEKIADSY